MASETFQAKFITVGEEAERSLQEAECLPKIKVKYASGPS